MLPCCSYKCSIIVHVVKAVIIVISVNLSTLFVASHILSTKVAREWRLNLGFGTQKNCPFPLNRGVPSTRLCEWGHILCILNGQSCPKERFHCIIFYFQLTTNTYKTVCYYIYIHNDNNNNNNKNNNNNNNVIQ